MRITKTLVLAAVLTTFAAVAMFAYPRDYDKRDMDRRDKIVKMEKAEKRTAQKVLKRTTAVIVSAQKAVKRNQVYTGDLFRAYQHQKFAKNLFANGDYDRAVRQSLRARQFAYQAMEGNRTRINQDYDRDERNFRQNMKNDELDRDDQQYWDRMKNDDAKRDQNKRPNQPQPPMKDDDVVKINIHAEFGD